MCAAVVEDTQGDFLVTLHYENNHMEFMPRSLHCGSRWTGGAKTSDDDDDDDDNGGGVLVEWGCYRGSAREWQLPSTLEVPAGSDVIKRGFMEVVTSTMEPCTATDDATQRQHSSFSLRIPGSTAPLTLAFAVGGVEGAVPIGMTRGRPYPLGASLVYDGEATGELNFAVASHHAERMALCFVHSAGGEVVLEIELDAGVHKTGDVWHVSVARLLEDVVSNDFSGALLNELSWGWRARGTISENGPWLRETEIILDTYARELTQSTGLASFRPLLQEYAGVGNGASGSVEIEDTKRPRRRRRRRQQHSRHNGTEQEEDERTSSVVMEKESSAGSIILDVRGQMDNSSSLSLHHALLQLVPELKAECASLAVPATAILVPPLYSVRDGTHALFCPTNDIVVGKGGVESGDAVKTCMRDFIASIHDADIDIIMDFPLTAACALCRVHTESECVAVIVSAVKEWVHRWEIDGFCFNDTDAASSTLLARLMSELAFESSLSHAKMFQSSSSSSPPTAVRLLDSPPSVAACLLHHHLAMAPASM